MRGRWGSFGVMATQEHFRVSSSLKDVIGRDLVTNEFVALFELVKNSFDAGASRVDIVFDNDAGELWIADDGKGMDADGIRDRWLFVAYSAKKDGSERETTQADYRDRIRPNGQFAGSKGIGRFSCDTLGGQLTMYTRTSRRRPTEVLSVDWSRFEQDSHRLFHRVGVALSQEDGFPSDAPVAMPVGAGTVLRIGERRNEWDTDKIWRLRQYLGKLIDPFGTTDDTPVHIAVIDQFLDEDEIGWLSGPIANDIRDVLQDKTTRIVVNIENDEIRTELIDRSRTIYRIKERSEYQNLAEASIQMEIFYLNRSAKHTFTSRMQVRPVEFGSIFLFLNGFRVFPLGEENDDTLGLNRRKQQGQTRYLGTRDLLGRVDVVARAGLFREASSRDAGLIRDVAVDELYDAIIRKAVLRLERYVVGVTWADKTDADRDDDSGFEQLSTRSRVAGIIGQLAARGAVEIEYYDPAIVELFESDAASLERTLGAIVSIAERSGDAELLSRVERARARQAQLEQSEREARDAAREAMAAAARANERIALLQRQAQYLASTQDMTVEQMTFLLHQVLIYANHIGAAVDRGLNYLAEAIGAAKEIQISGEEEDIVDAAAAIRHNTSKAQEDLELIHLENDRLIAVARFASNARFDLETNKLDGDVVAFLDEYVNQVRAARDGSGSISFEANGLEQHATFPPVDLVVVVDNLMDNARKHGARKLSMVARQTKAGVEVDVSDDGRGMDEDRVDALRLFDKGYTSTPNGTGLGLFHVRQVLAAMGGSIMLDPTRMRGRVDFVITLPKDQK